VSRRHGRWMSYSVWQTRWPEGMLVLRSREGCEVLGRVFLSICLFACIFRKHTAELHRFLVHVARGRDSVLNWEHRYVLPVLWMTCFNAMALRRVTDRTRQYQLTVLSNFAQRQKSIYSLWIAYRGRCLPSSITLLFFSACSCINTCSLSNFFTENICPHRRNQC